MVDQQVAPPTYSLFGAKSDSWPLSHTNICYTKWESNSHCTLKQFWCRIGRTSTECIQFTAGHKFIAESEICNLDVHLRVQEKILSFQIAVNDPFLVTILDGRYDLWKSRKIKVLFGVRFTTVETLDRD